MCVESLLFEFYHKLKAFSLLFSWFVGIRDRRKEEACFFQAESLFEKVVLRSFHILDLLIFFFLLALGCRD